MQTNSPWTFLNAINHLAQANMTLFGASAVPTGDGRGTASAVNPMALTMLLVQGLTKNYVQFFNEINAGSFALLAGQRGVLIPIVQGE